MLIIVISLFLSICIGYFIDKYINTYFDSNINLILGQEISIIGIGIIVLGNSSSDLNLIFYMKCLGSLILIIGVVIFFKELLRKKGHQ